MASARKKNSPDRVLTTGQAARALQVAPRTISKYVDSGRITGCYRLPPPATLTGVTKDDVGDRRIPLASLWDFCKRNGIPIPKEYAADRLIVCVGNVEKFDPPAGCKIVRVDTPIQAYKEVADSGALALVVVSVSVGSMNAIELIKVIPSYHYRPVVVVEDDTNKEYLGVLENIARVVRRPVDWSEVVKSIIPEVSK